MERTSKSASFALMAELQNYSEQGISIWLNGTPSSPDRICDACRVREGTSYMRDYVFDENVLREIHFDRVEDPGKKKKN